MERRGERNLERGRQRGGGGAADEVHDEDDEVDVGGLGTSGGAHATADAARLWDHVARPSA